MQLTPSLLAQKEQRKALLGPPLKQPKSGLSWLGQFGRSNYRGRAEGRAGGRKEGVAVAQCQQIHLAIANAIPPGGLLVNGCTCFLASGSPLPSSPPQLCLTEAH